MGKKKKTKHLKKKLDVSDTTAETNTAENLLTIDDLSILKEFVNHIKSNQSTPLATEENSLQEEKETEVSVPEFNGDVQSTTIKLHVEVRDKLNAYCEENKVTKKDIVNQALWSYLHKVEA